MLRVRSSVREIGYMIRSICNSSKPHSTYPKILAEVVEGSMGGSRSLAGVFRAVKKENVFENPTWLHSDL